MLICFEIRSLFFSLPKTIFTNGTRFTHWKCAFYHHQIIQFSAHVFTFSLPYLFGRVKITILSMFAYLFSRFRYVDIDVEVDVVPYQFLFHHSMQCTKFVFFFRFVLRSMRNCPHFLLSMWHCQSVWNGKRESYKIVVSVNIFWYGLIPF